MGDREAESGVPVIVGGADAAPPQLLASQVSDLANQAQALADQAQTLEAPYDDDVERAEKSAFAYKEITILHDINEHYPIYKLALEEWERREKHLSNSISRREDQSAQLTNQIYSILGTFAIFQGVVLIAVSQLTQKASIELRGASLCRKTWLPILLTGIATLVTIVGILYKFKCLQSLGSTIQTETQAKIEIAHRANTLRRKGPKNFKFTLDTNNFMHHTKSKLVKKQLFVIWFLLVITLMFTLVFIMSYIAILCDKK